jgi:lipoprotein-anchoring transpeptidase ErfK/SrfK
MSARPGRPLRSRASRQSAVLAGLVVAAVAVAGCTSAPGPQAASPRQDGSAGSTSSPAPSSAAPVTSAASVVTNVGGSDVAVDKVLRVDAREGTLETVAVRVGDTRVKGELSEDATRWTAAQRLEPGKRYLVRAVAEDADGVRTTRTSSFRTAALTLDQQTYPSFAPLAGETVGVGMPVVVTFDVPVTDKASIERHLEVTNTSGQQGAWHWISDSEVHWRPASYWKPGTDVTVTADINSIPAGRGIYGQLSRTSTFHVGDSVISRVNAQTHQMKTFVNGRLAKTTPITTGKPGFTTRSGTKVIIEKFRQKRMNSETVGIAAGSADAYDIDDVEYAMRVTYSGEFLHAAPWSIYDQGRANVSHGCTGMSTEDAAWIYNISKRGDVVEYTGTDRPMTLDNGLGDWNASFASYRQGSALS